MARHREACMPRSKARRPDLRKPIVLRNPCSAQALGDHWAALSLLRPSPWVTIVLRYPCSAQARGDHGLRYPCSAQARGDHWLRYPCSAQARGDHCVTVPGHAFDALRLTPWVTRSTRCVAAPAGRGALGG
jgi:hypothetical protein